MKRVMVVTTFVELWEAYSLCSVVGTQLRSLLDHGYDCTFVACDGCVTRGIFADPRLGQLRLPTYHLDPDLSPADRGGEYVEGVARIKERLRPGVAQADVVITHDIIYLPHYLAYNQACRELSQEFPGVLWLHWIHSAPQGPRDFEDGDPRILRFRHFPRGLLVYPNAADVPRVAQQYGVEEDSVRVVPHAFDYAAVFDFHPITQALVNRFDLYDPDIFGIYPIRMDRGKQPEKLVRLFAAVKRSGKSVRLLILNFHSTGAHFVEYQDEIAAEARSLGLTDRELIFTNQIRSLPGIAHDELNRCSVELPHKVVIDLFHLTNVYIHTSASETYSLVCQEAAACGNLLLLNDDFPPMRDVYGPHALYFKFCSTLIATSYSPSEAAYYDEVARKLIYCLDSERTIRQRTRIRQTRNPDAVFRDHLEPLLYADLEEGVLPTAAASL